MRSITQIIDTTVKYLFQIDLSNLYLIKELASVFFRHKLNLPEGEKREKIIIQFLSFFQPPLANHHVEQINTNTPMETNETVFSGDTVAK